jgi:hypothetical protein
MTFNCLLVRVTISVGNRTYREFPIDEAPAVCHSELGFAGVRFFLMRVITTGKEVWNIHQMIIFLVGTLPLRHRPASNFVTLRM